MTEETEKKKSYIKRIMAFYFKPQWQSLFPILYLIFFGYFTVFYAGNLWVGFKFLFFTLRNSAALLGLSYLFWGVLFMLGLIIPFFASIYAIALLYEIWEDHWTRYQKSLLTVLIIIGTPLLIILMDGLIRIVVNQPVLYDFVIINNLSISGITM